jgi:hypothetical protein
MSALNLKFEYASLEAQEQPNMLPVIKAVEAVGPVARANTLTRNAQRQLRLSRLTQPVDDGFRPFRIY